MDIPEQPTGTGTILRNHSLTVRLSDFEVIRVAEQARMAGTNVSQWARSVLLPDEDRQTLNKRVDELEAFKARLERMVEDDREVLDRLR